MLQSRMVLVIAELIIWKVWPMQEPLIEGCGRVILVAMDPNKGRSSWRCLGMRRLAQYDATSESRDSGMNLV